MNLFAPKSTNYPETDTEMTPLLGRTSPPPRYIAKVREALEGMEKSCVVFHIRYPRSYQLLVDLRGEPEDPKSKIEEYISSDGNSSEVILNILAEELCEKISGSEKSGLSSQINKPKIAESIKLLLNQDKEVGKKIGFKDLNELDVDKLEVILSFPIGIKKMFDVVDFNQLEKLDIHQIKEFLSHPDAIRMIYERTVAFEDLKNLDIEKLKVFLSHPDAIEIMSKSGIKFDSLKELDTNKLKAFLSNEDGLREMFKSEVVIDSANKFAAVLLSNQGWLIERLKTLFKFDSLKELNADNIEVCLSHPNEIKKIFMIKDCFDKLKVLNTDKLEVCLSNPDGFRLILENEVYLDSLKELDTEKLSVLLSKPKEFNLMLKNEVNLDSLMELDTEKLAVFLSHPHGLKEMFKNKVSFDSLKELDTKKLEVLLSNEDGIRTMFENKIAFDILKELDTGKLAVFMSYPMGLQKIFDNNINFNQLKELDTNKIHLLLWHRDALQEMFDNGVSFEQLKSLDTSELEHLLAYSEECVAILTGSEADLCRQNLRMLIGYMFSPQRDDERIKLSVERLQLLKSEISGLATTYNDESLNQIDREDCRVILKSLEAKQYASARDGIKNLFDSIEPQNHRLNKPKSSLAKLHDKLKIALEEIDFNLLILKGMIEGHQGVINYSDYNRIDDSKPLNPTLNHLYRMIENKDFSLLHMKKFDFFQLNKLLKNKDSFLACIHGLEDDVRGRFISEFKTHFLDTIGLDISRPPNSSMSLSLFRLRDGVNEARSLKDPLALSQR